MKLIFCFYFVLCFCFCSAFSNALKAQELNVNQDYQKAVVCYKAGQYAEALQHAKNAINDDPNSWQSYGLEGYCDFYLGIKMKWYPL